MAVWSSRKIAAAWDNEAGFAVVEAISVSGTTLQLEDVVKGFPFAANTHFYIHGGSSQVNRMATADGGSVQNGYETIAWNIPICTGVALKHWIDTYVGKVTIATTRYDITTYENWNAMAGYPEYSADRRHYYLGHWWYLDVKVMMKLVATT